MKKLFTLLLAAILLSFITTESVFAQLSIDALSTNYTIDFDATVSDVNNGTYTGTGFLNTPGTGQLDADAWAISGLSDGDKAFGVENTSGDHARGFSSGGVSTGGLYAFDIGSGNIALGFQPAGSDWTPGSLTLKIQNNTGSSINSLDVTYTIYVLNDQGRGNDFNLAYSFDDMTYTNVTSLDFTSTEAADGSPTWTQTVKTTTISGLDIADGDFYFIRWYGDDNLGGGSRDEFAIDDIIINGSAVSGDVVDWCNLQWPANGTIDEGGNHDVYAQVWEDGVTNSAGQGAGIEAWIGYNTEDTDPSTWTNWVTASYNKDEGNNDEYMADIGPDLEPGTYYYASRFRLNSGVYSYGGYNGGFWDGSTNVSGVLTVNAIFPDINDVTYTPTTPTSSDDVLVGANITAPGTVTDADIQWGTVSGVYTSTINMDNGGSGDTYTATISAMADGTTVYFVVFAENDGTYSTTSSEYSFTFSDISEVTIYDIQYTTDPGGDSPYLGQVVTTSGIVTAYYNDGEDSNYFIQDGDGAWNGIYVYDDTYTATVGDDITITAEVDEFFNLTELKNVSEVTVNSQGNTLPNATVLTTSAANAEDYEGVLIQVLDAECTNDDAGFGMFELNDGSGALLVDDDYFSYTATLGTNYNVTGLGFYSFSDYKIIPRDANDIEEAVNIVSISDQIKVYPNPSNGHVNIALNGKFNAELIDISGRTISAGEFNNNAQLTIDNAGMYFIRISNDTEMIIEKVIIK